jgi:hypothetical protein
MWQKIFVEEEEADLADVVHVSGKAPRAKLAAHLGVDIRLLTRHDEGLDGPLLSLLSGDGSDLGEF